MSGYKTNSGANLLREWRIPARQARYHKDGTWFMPLDQFPGALCDPHGYVLFDKAREYSSSPDLEIGRRVNVRMGISRIRGYVHVK